MAQQREVAWRVFAGEYNVSSLENTSSGDRMPSYVVTPLGAKIGTRLAEARALLPGARA